MYNTADTKESFSRTGLVLSTDGYNPPCDEITNKKGKETGCNTKYNENEPDHGRVGIHHLTEAATNACNFSCLFVDRNNLFISHLEKVLFE